jgi:hypothetical protein
MVLLIDRRPRPALGFLRANAPVFIAFFDVFGLALLLVGVA